jgi:hypothetical protein
VYVGHFPYVARSFVGRDTITFTLLRDPVERTISVLRHCKRYHEHQRHLSLDEIYDDAFVFPLYIHNHQAKMFAMTLDDRLESHLDVIDVDERRLDIAKANLARVDVVGFTEQYDEFIADMSHRFGWQFGAVPNMRVSEEEWNISDALRERIVVDNAADVAFYEFARELCAGPRSRA